MRGGFHGQLQRTIFSCGSLERCLRSYTGSRHLQRMERFRDDNGEVSCMFLIVRGVSYRVLIVLRYLQSSGSLRCVV